MLKIYTSTTDYLNDDNEFDAGYQKASEYRKRKIDVLCNRIEKNRSLAAELLLIEALEENGIAYDGEIVLGEHGKPCLANNNDIHFSISHSGNVAMCVISDCEVGCDVEKIERLNDKIAKRFFTEEEWKSVSRVENIQRRTVLYARLWCLKESYGKMTGEGLGGVIDKMQFDVSNVAGGHLAKTEYHFWEQEGYCYAFCKSET